MPKNPLITNSSLTSLSDSSYQSGNETFIQNVLSCTAEITELKAKKNAALPVIQNAIFAATEIDDLNALYACINKHPAFAFIKTRRNPWIFKSYLLTKSSCNIGLMFFQAIKNLFMTKAIQDPQSVTMAFFSQIETLLTSLQPAIYQDKKNIQIFDLLLQLSRGISSDQSFFNNWSTFINHPLKKLPLCITLQNLSMFESQCPSLLEPLHLFLIALSYHKLHHHDEDIASEAKYNGLKYITQCIKQAENLPSLRLIYFFLQQEGFNFLRLHQYPNLAKIQNAFQETEKLTDSWKSVLSAIRKQANSIYPTIDFDDFITPDTPSDASRFTP